MLINKLVFILFSKKQAKIATFTKLSKKKPIISLILLRKTLFC